MIWTTAAAAGALVLLGIAFVARGYAVPTVAIFATLMLSAIGGLLAYVFRQFTFDSSARFADRWYHLQDAISSYLHFSRRGRSDGFYKLQAEQTCERVESLDPREIKYDFPRRGAALAACLVAIAVPLGLRGPSEKVLHEQQLAAATAEATASINEELAKKVDDIREESPAGEERELLKPNELREWVDELRETHDHMEALRQYAQLERKLNEARLSLQKKRDEQLLERAAREMENTRETQPLAEQLKQKKYDQAAEQMEKMTPMSEEKPFDKQRQELARLKAAAQHMAAAARSAKPSSANAKSSAGANSSSSDGASGASGEGGEMSQAMDDLASSVADLDKSLSEAQRQVEQKGECDANKKGECQACKECVSNNLSKLSKQLKQMAMRQRADARLCKLCQSCSQCQGNLSSMCQSPNAGGKKAGAGTNSARRDERDELVDNGQTTPLQGTKGQGPSLTTVETAEDGSGVSTRKAVERERKFQRQFESFVAREDIPDEVKDGVKQYFEVIHQVAPDLPRQETRPDAGDGQ